MKGVTPADDRYAWRWEWDDPFGNSVRLKKEQRGGPGWDPYYPWEQGNMGTAAWLELLANGGARPNGSIDGVQLFPFEDCFIHPYPYHRSSDDLQDWFESTYEEETAMAQKIFLLEQARSAGVSPREYRSLLNRLVPKRRRACDWPTRCAMQDTCWEGLGIEQRNPMETGLFAWREPHHDAERRQLSA